MKQGHKGLIGGGGPGPGGEPTQALRDSRYPRNIETRNYVWSSSYNMLLLGGSRLATLINKQKKSIDNRSRWLSFTSIASAGRVPASLTVGSAQVCSSVVTNIDIFHTDNNLFKCKQDGIVIVLYCVYSMQTGRKCQEARRQSAATRY